MLDISECKKSFIEMRRQHALKHIQVLQESVALIVFNGIPVIALLLNAQLSKPLVMLREQYTEVQYTVHLLHQV